MNKIYSFLLLCIMLSAKAFAQCDPIPDFYNGELVYNAPVQATKLDSNILFTAGTFNLAGRYSGTFAALTASGNRIPWPKFNGHDNVGYTSSGNKFVSDGHKGYIVYGQFDMAGNTPCGNLARVDSAGNLSTFLPIVNAAITDAIVSNDTLYIVGAFSQVNSQTRNGLAAFSLVTGNLLPLNITSNGYLYAIEKKADTLYIGGQFSLFNGATRKNFAAINSKTGVLTNFKADATDPVYTSSITKLYKMGDTLIASGVFRYIADSNRRNIASINLLTGRADSLLFYCDYGVNTFKRYGDTLFFGGAFTNINGSYIRSFAAMKISTGTMIYPYSVTFGSNGDQIYGIYKKDNTLYLSGDFNTINDSTRYGMVLLNASNCAVLPTRRDIIGFAKSINIDSSGNLVLCGNMTSINPVRRQHIVAYDLARDSILPWNQNGLKLINITTYETISSIDVTKGTVFVSGKFDNLTGTAPRKNLAALSRTTGNLLPFSVSINNSGSINKIAVYKGRLYVAGYYSVMGGLFRFGLASLDTATGAVSSWDPSTSNTNSFMGMEFKDSTLYVCGQIYGVGGVVRNNAAAININSGLATNWNPNVNNYTTYIKVVGNTVYLHGDFVTSVGGQPSNNLAAIDATTGALKPLNLNIHYFPTSSNLTRITAIEGINDKIIVAGRFDSVSSAPRFCLAAIDTNTGIATSWHPLRSVPYFLNRYGNRLYYSGRANLSDYPTTSYPTEMGAEGTYRFTLQDIAPQASLSANNTTLCAGDTVKLTGYTNITASATYQWKVNNNNVGTNNSSYNYVPNNGDVITLMVSGPGTTCTTPATSTPVTITVTPKTIPTITVNAPTTVPVGQTVNCTANVTNAGTGYSINWYINNVKKATTTTTSYSYTKAAGEDTVTAVIKNTTGCYDTATSPKQIVSVQPNGVDNINGKESYTLNYYNSNGQKQALIQAAANTEATLILLDESGRTIFNRKIQLQQGSNQVSLPELTPGIYLLALKINGNVLTQKISLF